MFHPAMTEIVTPHVTPVDIFTPREIALQKLEETNIGQYFLAQRKLLGNWYMPELVGKDKKKLGYFTGKLTTQPKESVTNLVSVPLTLGNALTKTIETLTDEKVNWRHNECGGFIVEGQKFSYHASVNKKNIGILTRESQVGDYTTSEVLEIFLEHMYNQQ